MLLQSTPRSRPLQLSFSGLALDASGGAVITHLQEELPELAVYGNYLP